MLIGYESGQIAFWDLKLKNADYRCQTDIPLRSISWHHEGKQFMSSHTDGSLITWTVRQVKATNVTHPHGEKLFIMLLCNNISVLERQIDSNLFLPFFSRAEKQKRSHIRHYYN